jgi:hypothetical protein
LPADGDATDVVAMACACLLWALLLAAPAQRPAGGPPNQAEDEGGEPKGGAGVSPIEIVPRLELRLSSARQSNGVAIHDATVETSIQFARRLLMQYQVPYRLVDTPSGQSRGPGDIQVRTLGILTADPRRLVALLLGLIVDTASPPTVGGRTKRLLLGGGAAVKPHPSWIAYGLAQHQLSIGSGAGPRVNQLDLLLGSILFGWQHNWARVELVPRIDFHEGIGALFGNAEVGALMIGRVGLFVRVGTQLAGTREVDYVLTGGMRYLFRLER